MFTHDVLEFLGRTSYSVFICHLVCIFSDRGIDYSEDFDNYKHGRHREVAARRLVYHASAGILAMFSHRVTWWRARVGVLARGLALRAVSSLFQS